MMLATKVGNSGSVVAVEPNPFNVRLGKLSNAFENIVQLQAMFSSTNGSGVISHQLNGRPFSSEPGSSGLTVPSMTIDELPDNMAPQMWSLSKSKATNSKC
jgi:hypothetical protein